MSATQADEVTTSVRNSSGAWEVIAREPAGVVDLDTAALSTDDVGGEPGTVYRVALVRDEDGVEREIRAVEITAHGPPCRTGP